MLLCCKSCICFFFFLFQKQPAPVYCCISVPCSIKLRTLMPDPATKTSGSSSTTGKKRKEKKSFYFFSDQTLIITDPITILSYFRLLHQRRSIHVFMPNQLHWIAVIFCLRGRTCTSEEPLPRRSSLPAFLSGSISVTQIVIILTLWIIYGPGQLNQAATELRANGRGLRGYWDNLALCSAFTLKWKPT